MGLPTQSENFSGTGRSINLHTSTPSHTEISERRSSGHNFLRPQIGSTQVPNNAETVRIFKIAKTEARKIVEKKATKNYLKGAITEFDEISVKCKIYIESQETIIELARPLFPESIQLGSPISIEMVDQDGIRKPKISLRELNPKNSKKIEEEFDRILSEI